MTRTIMHVDLSNFYASGQSTGDLSGTERGGLKGEYGICVFARRISGLGGRLRGGGTSLRALFPASGGTVTGKNLRPVAGTDYDDGRTAAVARPHRR